MDFFKVYVDFIKKMKNLTKSEIVVLLHLSMSMDYGNKIFWDKDMQEIMSYNLKIDRRTLQNLISRLIAKEMIRREGFYIVINDALLKKGSETKWRKDT